MNQAISDMYEFDQADRSADWDKLDVVEIEKRDVERLEFAYKTYNEFLDKNLDLDKDDLFKLGMLFQHSSKKEDYLIAMELGQLSGDLGSESGLWLSAAAEDRYLVEVSNIQKWGTQFYRDNRGVWQQFPLLEDIVTDDDRLKRGVPIIANQMKDFIAKRNK